MKLGGRRFSMLPVARLAQSKLLRRSSPSVHDTADASWELAPPMATTRPRSFFLPGQIERIAGWEFIDEHPGPVVTGGQRVQHGPTRASLLREAWIIDGVLYHGRACEHLRPRRHRLPRLEVETTIDRGALAVSPAGNRWFGMWLLDDCPRYVLAEEEGIPIATGDPPSEHQHDYEKILRMRPRHCNAAYFRELVVFDDMAQNHHKRRRMKSLIEQVRGSLDPAPARHPGVFLIRGLSGQRRVLVGERDLAERLAVKRGFRVLDPMAESVATIIEACAGARVIAGVEGSHLSHAMLALAPDSCILTLQPPNRFVSIYKDVADRDGYHFGFVVGVPAGRDFAVDADEVERTLDLFPAP